MSTLVEHRAPLLRDTLREHRLGAITWIVVGGLTMIGSALAIGKELDDFPGGPAALAASVEAGAEALRLMRWPAERLDTLGGYLTYHNVILFNLGLAIYGVVQGAKEIRGAEDRGSGELLLATGHSRPAVLRDRTLGFAVIALLIGLGIGLAVAVGVGDVAGSLITMGTAGLLAVVGFGLGVLLSQVLSSSRAAAGLGAAVLLVLYVATNLAGTALWADVLNVVSPFHYANASRALVPGYGLDPLATAVLIAMAGVLLALAGAAYVARDYGAPLWRRAPRAVGPARIPRFMLGSVWSSTLRRGWVGLLVWTGCTAAFLFVFARLQPAVMDVWQDFSFAAAITAGTGAASIEQAYWSFVGELVTPVVAAYIVTASAGWVGDLTSGRVEAFTAAPVSWPMLVRGRVAAAATGAAAITAGVLAGLLLGAGGGLDAAGLFRVLVVGAVFGFALAGVAALVVALIPRTAAVTVMAVVVAAMYLVWYLTPVFEWPDWLNRLSVFWAFGHPYVVWPGAVAWAVLLVLGVGGTVAAIAVARRSPKVPV